jgi:hypothetical protein
MIPDAPAAKGGGRMEEDNRQSVPITVGDQTFRIRVRPDEVERYQRVAASANQALEGVVAAGALRGPKALTMALFQLACELDETRERSTFNDASRHRLQQLIDRIDEATGESGVKGD